ncbi:cyclin dependent kinase binding protein [Cardiosporidium cionae]|uniref:Cyclin dependent kinase binding protein n=1 Tax=Cardiosporidium cionae TaxID=476202 RepID=A0ABQ7J5Q3_9APIC|nr:cyclin dependent kinase binding protein [Cardiosporidium cionae]|eukprot:KAF8819293.1 cyclin dependent kinase binding protein [Cardiosporidium cionae]
MESLLPKDSPPIVSQDYCKLSSLSLEVAQRFLTSLYIDSISIVDGNGNETDEELSDRDNASQLKRKEEPMEPRFTFMNCIKSDYQAQMERNISDARVVVYSNYTPVVCFSHSKFLHPGYGQCSVQSTNYLGNQTQLDTKIPTDHQVNDATTSTVLKYLPWVQRQAILFRRSLLFKRKRKYLKRKKWKPLYRVDIPTPPQWSTIRMRSSRPSRLADHGAVYLRPSSIQWASKAYHFRKRKLPQSLHSLYIVLSHSLFGSHPRRRAPLSSLKHGCIPKKGISYAELLVPSDYKYDPYYFNNPRYKQGKHHTVMKMPGYTISIIPFVKPKKLKEEINEQFREMNPWISSALTLSKIRNLKNDLFGLISQFPMLDISTVAAAWVYFERLVMKRIVHKLNRKLCAVACLVLSYKFNQDFESGILKELAACFPRLDRQEHLGLSEIYQAEFQVFMLLDFSLQVQVKDIIPHIRSYLESKDKNFEDVYGFSEQALIASADILEL